MGGFLSLATKLEGALGTLEFAAVAREWAERSGELIVERMKAEAPVNKNAGGDPSPEPAPGTLRDSIAADTSELGTVKVTAVGYAEYVINSTQPHLIEGDPLAFYEGGQAVFATNVEHPGTTANPFHKRAWEASREEVVSSMRMLVAESLHK